MKQKTLDVKLARLRKDHNCGDFILADAKDADMAFGVAAPGQSPEHHASEGHFKSLEDYRESIRKVVEQGLVDIMLMSAHTNAMLAIDEGIFKDSTVTPAARANDTTDIHVVRGGVYTQQPSRPFRTTTIDHIQCGRASCEEGERDLGANLGLYSVTFNNDLERDHRTLEAYRQFRIEAEQKGFRHFLEVFSPNAPQANIAPEMLGGYINDMIARMLAGVPESGRPVFLKIVYPGPKYTEELAAYDPSLIIGVLGGSSGTTYDAFKLVADAQKYGARAALFGRKINNAEHQLAFIEMLRRILDGQVTPEEAVYAYHGVLASLNITPHRSIEDDLMLTETAISYGGGKTVSVPSSKSVAPSKVQAPAKTNGKAAVKASAPASKSERPDFGSMSSAERLAYHKRRLQGLR